MRPAAGSGPAAGGVVSAGGGVRRGGEGAVGVQAAQRALVVMRERAANEAKSEFMSLMCHEVRTPLNGCLASAEMLLDTPLLDEQRELTNTIRISGSILLSTVSNFLDYFKVQAGKKLDIVRTPFYLMDIISDVHAIVEAMMGPQSPVRPPPPLRIYYNPPRSQHDHLQVGGGASQAEPQETICGRQWKRTVVRGESHGNSVIGQVRGFGRRFLAARRRLVGPPGR